MRIHNIESLTKAGMALFFDSVDDTNDTYDNALANIFNGLLKAEDPSPVLAQRRDRHYPALID